MTAGSSAAAGRIQVGSVLAGKYRVDKVLGEGGMGVVVAATHLQLDEPVAIKLLHAHLATEPELVTRFQREAKAARKIRSEHVVRILDVGELESGAPFMVMEHLEGTDLEAYVRSHGPQSVSDAVDYVLQACEALAEAHVQGMVHRDLKPANLFVSRRADQTPLVKVLDFGISKVTGSGGADLGVTKTNAAVLGSPLYMAPEQMRSLRDVDARTDIWALGVILHELLTGVPPFTGTTLPELCAMILQDPPPPVRTIRPDVPIGLEAAIGRCLEKEPAQRYPDVAALAMELHSFASLAGRASAERIFGVYRAAGIPRASKPPTPEESARTMALAPSTGPSLPLAVITPRAVTVGMGSTASAWTAGDSMPAPIATVPPPAGGSGVVIALVAAVAVLATIVVVFVVVPRLKPSPVAVDGVAASSVAASSVAPPPPPPLVAGDAPTTSASAAPPAPAAPAPAPAARPSPRSHGLARPAAAPASGGQPDCTVPYAYDAQGRKRWKPECLN